MRILHFYKTFFPNTTGGMEQTIHQLARTAAQHGVETDILSLSRKVRHQQSVTHADGYTAHTVPQIIEISSMGCSLAVFKRFAQLAAHADVIHYHFPWPWMDLVHFVTRVNKPTIVTYQSDIIRQKHALKFYSPLMHRFLKSVDYIVATSPNYCKSSLVLQNYKNKTRVIPLGLDRSSYLSPSIDCLNKWRERLPQPFFLFVGVLRYYKGLHILLESAIATEYPIVIAGTGPYEQKLKQQAAALNLTNVIFLGAITNEDKVALFSLCYAVVFPSNIRSEAFGLALLEGAMFGKPMISCEIGTGTSFINQHGQTGLTIAPNDAHALNKAMKFLWSHPEEAALMGQRAEARYWQLFTAEHMTTEYLSLYREAIATHKDI